MWEKEYVIALEQDETVESATAALLKALPFEKVDGGRIFSQDEESAVNSDDDSGKTSRDLMTETRSQMKREDPREEQAKLVVDGDMSKARELLEVILIVAILLFLLNSSIR